MPWGGSQRTLNHLYTSLSQLRNDCAARCAYSQQAAQNKTCCHPHAEHGGLLQNHQQHFLSVWLWFDKNLMTVLYGFFFRQWLKVRMKLQQTGKCSQCTECSKLQFLVWPLGAGSQRESRTIRLNIKIMEIHADEKLAQQYCNEASCSFFVVLQLANLFPFFFMPRHMFLVY